MDSPERGVSFQMQLSYVIIKANGREIRVTVNKGEGAELIIQLPDKEI